MSLPAIDMTVMSRSLKRSGLAGRTILFIAGLAVFISGPAQTYGVSTFVEPMIDELGVSRSVFSTAYSFGTLVSAIALMIIGRQIDRWGSRIIMALATLIFAAALGLLSVANTPAALLIGFALLRTCGSGVLTLAARTLIPHWFARRRGRAFSMLGLAGAISLALIPLAHSRTIEWLGWRGAWRLDAVILLLVFLPAVLLLVKNRPEDIGQFPDGVRPAADDPTAVSDAGVGLTLRQALRTPAFWALVGASVVPSLVVTGLAFNQVAIFTDRGLPTTLAATTFTVESIFLMVITLGVGWLVDRYPVRYSLAAGQIALALAMVCLLLADGPVLALVYAALRGTSAGFWMVAADVAWPAYYGRRHLGAIRGFGFSFGVAGAAIGPLPFGLAYDFLGGYTPAIVALLVLPVLATIAVLLTRPPKLEPGRDEAAV